MILKSNDDDGRCLCQDMLFTFVGASLGSEGASLELEFDRYSASVYYPTKNEILELAVLRNRYEENNKNGNNDATFQTDIVSALLWQQILDALKQSLISDRFPAEMLTCFG